MTFSEESSLEKIGARSFFGAGIEKVVIPKRVVEVMDGAFRECAGLKEVVFEDGS